MALAFTIVAFGVSEDWLWLGEQVEDRQLFLGEPLGDGALFFFGQRLRRLDEPAQVLVDVDAAGVVVGDELLDALNEVVARRVTGRRADRSLLEQGRQAVGLGPLASGEAGGEGVEVDLRQVDERVGVAAFGGGADDVLLGADGTIEQRVNGVGDRSRSATGGRETSATRSASTRMAATVCCCAAAGGSGSKALNSLRTWRAAARNAVRVSSSTSSALDSGVAKGDVRETRSRRAVRSGRRRWTRRARPSCRRLSPSASTSAVDVLDGRVDAGSAFAAP